MAITRLSKEWEQQDYERHRARLSQIQSENVGRGPSPPRGASAQKRASSGQRTTDASGTNQNGGRARSRGRPRSRSPSPPVQRISASPNTGTVMHRFRCDSRGHIIEDELRLGHAQQRRLSEIEYENMLLLRRIEGKQSPYGPARLIPEWQRDRDTMIQHCQQPSVLLQQKSRRSAVNDMATALDNGQWTKVAKNLNPQSAEAFQKQFGRGPAATAARNSSCPRDIVRLFHLLSGPSTALATAAQSSPAAYTMLLLLVRAEAVVPRHDAEWAIPSGLAKALRGAQSPVDDSSEDVARCFLMSGDYAGLFAWANDEDRRHTLAGIVLGDDSTNDSNAEQSGEQQQQEQDEQPAPGAGADADAEADVTADAVPEEAEESYPSIPDLGSVPDGSIDYTFGATARRYFWAFSSDDGDEYDDSDSDGDDDEEKKEPEQPQEEEEAPQEEPRIEVESPSDSLPVSDEGTAPAPAPAPSSYPLSLRIAATVLDGRELSEEALAVDPPVVVAILARSGTKVTLGDSLSATSPAFRDAAEALIGA